MLASGDGGQNWVDAGLGDRVVLGLVIPPGQPGVLFALTEADGLYRCQIEGSCWQKIEISLPQTMQRTIDREHPFWKPTLLQEELQKPAALAGTPALLALRFAPSAPQNAFLGTAGAGVYRSTDGGATWGPTGLSSGVIVSLAVHPLNPLQVYAAGETQVWSTADGGASWVDTGLSGLKIFALAYTPDGNLYAGTNNGIFQGTPTAWIHLGLDGLSIAALAAHPDQAGWLYAGSSDGLRISHDGGASWAQGSVELQGITVKDITFDPGDSSGLFISTATQGVLRMQE